MTLRDFCESLARGAEPAPIGDVASVYVILNRTTKRFYIGKSSNIANRFREHRSLLDRGIHHNPRLQAEWTSYGSPCFVLSAFPADGDIGELERSLVAEAWGDDCFNATTNGGGGRPTLNASGKVMKTRKFKALDAEWEKCLALGGSSFLRDAIKRAKLPKKVAMDRASHEPNEILSDLVFKKVEGKTYRYERDTPLPKLPKATKETL